MNNYEIWIIMNYVIFLYWNYLFYNHLEKLLVERNFDI